MTNPYLDLSLHDADLHAEWSRVDCQLHAAMESADEDLRASLFMERDQIAEAIRIRSIDRVQPFAQPGSRDPLPLQAF